MQLLVAQITVLLATMAFAAPSSRTGLVAGVADGDTLTPRSGWTEAFKQVNVRLAAIDAPERHRPFGVRSKQALSDPTSGVRSCYLAPRSIATGAAFVTCWWYRPVMRRADARSPSTGLAMVRQGMA